VPVSRRVAPPPAAFARPFDDLLGVVPFEPFRAVERLFDTLLPGGMLRTMNQMDRQIERSMREAGLPQSVAIDVSEEVGDTGSERHVCYVAAGCHWAGSGACISPTVHELLL